MTSWTDVINFVRARYEVLEEWEDWLRFRLPASDSRSQQVTVHHLAEHDGAEWAELSSAVGWADRVDLRRLLEFAGASNVVGAAVVDGVALIKYAMPLRSPDELDRGLRSVAATADEWERELSSGDEF